MFSALNAWLITDPLFYCVAIPAILLIGISKSGFGAGFGALAVPLMALTISVPEAAAILMPLLFVLDLLGLRAYRGGYDLQLLKFLLPWSLLGVLLGFLLFRYMNTHLVEGLVGIFAMLFLAQRLVFKPTSIKVTPPKWLGRILCTLSGFSSFIAHSGSPPLNAYLIPMRIPPYTFAATMAALFFFVNLAKWIPYAYLGLLDWRGMMTALVLMPCTPIGVWLGVRIAKKISQDLFYKFLYIGLFLTGIKLIFDGFLSGV